MHLLTLDGGMPWQWVSTEEGAHLAQLVNDAAIEAHTKYPDRFVAAVEMPIRNPEAALKELNRVAGKPGMRAVHLPNSMENGDFLFQPAYDPLWARCQELAYPVLFHPIDGEENIYGGKERLGNQLAASANLNNTLGFPFETATTAAKFIITGTLDKFPKLEIVLPHSGGCFPYVAGRIERGLLAKKFKLQRPFREYVRQIPLRLHRLLSGDAPILDHSGRIGSGVDRHRRLRSHGCRRAERARRAVKPAGARPRPHPVGKCGAALPPLDIGFRAIYFRHGPV